MNVRPENCLHVGDDPVADIEGARSLGIKTVFIKRRDLQANSDIQIKKLILIRIILK